MKGGLKHVAVAGNIKSLPRIPAIGIQYVTVTLHRAECQHAGYGCALRQGSQGSEVPVGFREKSWSYSQIGGRSLPMLRGRPSGVCSMTGTLSQCRPVCCRFVERPRSFSRQEGPRVRSRPVRGAHFTVHVLSWVASWWLLVRLWCTSSFWAALLSLFLAGCRRWGLSLRRGQLGCGRQGTRRRLFTGEARHGVHSIGRGLAPV